MSRNYEIIEQQNFYVKQNSIIPDDAIKIHGINNEICERKGKEISEVLLLLKNSVSDVITL